MFDLLTWIVVSLMSRCVCLDNLWLSPIVKTSGGMTTNCDMLKRSRFKRHVWRKGMDGDSTGTARCSITQEGVHPALRRADPLGATRHRPCLLYTSPSPRD